MVSRIPELTLSESVESSKGNGRILSMVETIAKAVDKISTPISSMYFKWQNDRKARQRAQQRPLGTESVAFGDFEARSEVEIDQLLDDIENGREGEAQELLERYGEHALTLVKVMRNRFDDFSRNVNLYPLTNEEKSDQKTRIWDKEQRAAIGESLGYMGFALFLYVFGSDIPVIKYLWSIGQLLPEQVNQWLHVAGGFGPFELSARSGGESAEIDGALWRALATFHLYKSVVFKGIAEPLKDGSWKDRQWELDREAAKKEGTHPYGTETTIEDEFAFDHTACWGFGDQTLLQMSFNDQDLLDIGIPEFVITKIRRERGLSDSEKALDISFVAVMREMLSLHGHNTDLVPIRRRVTELKTDTMNASLNDRDIEVSETAVTADRKVTEDNADLILNAGLLKGGRVMINVRDGLFESSIDGDPLMPPSLDIRTIYNALRNALFYREVMYGQNCPDIDVFLMLPQNMAYSRDILEKKSDDNNPFESIERRFKFLEQEFGGLKVHDAVVPEQGFAEDFMSTLDRSESITEANIFIDTTKAEDAEEKEKAIRELLGRGESEKERKVYFVDKPSLANIVLIVRNTDGDKESDIHACFEDYDNIDLIVYNYETRHDPVSSRAVPEGKRKKGIGSRHRSGKDFLRQIWQSLADKQKIGALNTKT